MDYSHPQDADKVVLHALYPRLSDDELKEAEENIERYVELALRIYDRLCIDSLASTRPLTAPKQHSTLASKVESL